MKVKYFRTLLIISVLAILLTGCSAQTTYLKPFTSAADDKDQMAASMLQTDQASGFAKDLGVISVSDAASGYGSEAMADVDATEIFLTGTTDAQVIAAKGIFNQMPPASITKILTALTALKSDADIDETFTLTDDVVIDIWDAQVCGYEPGDQVTLRTLLYSMLVYSGNDAANAVASAVSGGDIPAFCDQMNEVAASLGATHTHFVTPNGLDDPDHYTTAYDLYLIFRECLNYDLFKDAFGMSSYTGTYIHNGEEVSKTWESTNYYLLGNAYPPEGVHVIGGKTGTTDKAGLCLILYSETGESSETSKGYISVLLGSPDKSTLYASMTNLLSNIPN